MVGRSSCVAQTADQDYVTVRVDHQFSKTSSFFGRYTRDDAIRTVNNPLASSRF